MTPLENTTIAISTPFVLFLLILGLLGFVLLLRLFINRYLEKIAPTKPNRVLIIRALIKPLTITMIILSASIVLYYFQSNLPPTIIHLLLTILLFSWTGSGLTLAKQLIRAAAQNLSPRYQPRMNDAVPMLTSFAVTFIFFIALYALFLIWGINVTPLVAAISVIGAALSFAARDAVGNTISGISIFITQPFKVGDYIVVNDDFQGTIKEIGVQQTKLLSPTRTMLIIPNSTIITRPVENQTAIKPFVKFSLPLTLPLTTDIEHIKNNLIDAASQNSWLLPTPQPKIRYLDLTQDSVTLELSAALKDQTKHALVTHQLLQSIAKIVSKPEP